MKIRPIFAWYDLWVGVFWDAGKRRLYILPLPCVGIMLQFKPRFILLDALWPADEEVVEVKLDDGTITRAMFWVGDADEGCDFVPADAEGDSIAHRVVAWRSIR